METALLYSIHPEHCENIFYRGIKKREIRKVLPKIEFPCKVYVYQTKEKRLAVFLKKGMIAGCDEKSNDVYVTENQPVRRYNPTEKKVIGEFICTGYDKLVHCGTDSSNITLQIVDSDDFRQPITADYLKMCCLSYKQLEDYSNGGDLYALHISNEKLYDKPKDINDFMIVNKTLLKNCPYREKTYQNPDFINSGCLNGGPAFCRVHKHGGCADILKPLSRPPQSFCYVEEV